MSARSRFASPSTAGRGVTCSLILAGALGLQALGCGGHASEQAAEQPAKPAFVKLVRNAHPLAQKQFDVGPLEPEKRLASLSLVFKPTPAQEAEREAFKKELLDPTSPRWHEWLTPAEYAARFGASSEDVARATAWLKSQGLEVHAPSPLGARVRFSGTVAQVQSAFRTELRKYRVGGETHYAMSSAPSVPSELAERVLAIHGTHDFAPKPAIRSWKRAPEATCPTGDTFCKGNGLAPPDWASVYDVTPLYAKGVAGTPIDGTGIGIAIVGVAQIAKSDIDAFRTKYGLPATNLVTTLVPDTGTAVGGSGGQGEEAILDVEWSGGIAKGATVNYVFVGSDQQNVDIATFYAIENNLAPVLSESWGGCEAGNTPADADVIGVYGSAANLLGITYLASSGDEGADGCGGGYGATTAYSPAGLYTDLPASYPGVTAVGGTEFPIGSITYSGGVAIGYGTSELVWNEGNQPNRNLGSGGGGISNTFSRPSYQAGIPTCSIVGSLPTSATPSAMRQVPDVAVAAASGRNPYFIMCTPTPSGDCSSVGGKPTVLEIGGTSASAPAFAGVVALLNQATGGRLGNINPMLYALASSAPTSFHDITTGNNEVACTPGTDVGCASSGFYGYAAATGYDCASGLGSIDATNLVTAWAQAAPTTTTLATSTTTTTEGADVTLTATVAAVQPGATPIGGTVTFTFQSYLANGDPDLSWNVGEATISGGTTSSATASVTAKLPPGMIDPAAQYVDVVAMYGGEAQHLASRSTLARITLASPAFCITPGVKTVAPGDSFEFGSAFGVGAVRWYSGGDTTCDANGNGCSTLDTQTGVFMAGTGQPGWVLVIGIDSLGAETFSEITVGTPTTGTPPWGGDSGVLTSPCDPTVDASFAEVGPDAADAADSMAADTGVVDTGVVDTGAPDMTVVDTGVDDTGVDDTSVADTATPADTSVADANVADTSAALDTGVAEAGEAASVAGAGCSCETGARERSTFAPSLGLAAIALAFARRRRPRR